MIFLQTAFTYIVVKREQINHVESPMPKTQISKLHWELLFRNLAKGISEYENACCQSDK